MNIKMIIPCPNIEDSKDAPFPFSGELLLTNYNEDENNHMGLFIENIWSGKPKVPGLKTLLLFRKGIHLIVNADTEEKVRALLKDAQGDIVKEFKRRHYTVNII
jgi:hypothetical protein